MKEIKDIKIILRDKDSADDHISGKFSGISGVKYIDYSGEEDLGGKISSLQDEGYESKQVLIFKSFRGRFFQNCPGSPGMICCNYRVINSCFNCLYNCAYCFLNSYLNSFGIIFFTNIDRIFFEIDSFLGSAPGGMIYRVGTGEFTDSLMLDRISGLGKGLIERYCKTPDIMIELKTKSDNIDHLLSIKDKGNAVLAWSLNTERNVARYEWDTASLERRLDAAARACGAGFYLAFHFDPIIVYSGWEEDYRELVDRLFNKVDPERVAWISMGCFRYAPGFRECLRRAFPDEEMTVEEMFPGIDGKFRYLKNKRVDIYKKISGYIKRFTENPFLYLCMESGDVWHSVFNKYYTSSEFLERDFSDHLKRIVTIQ